MGPHEAEPFLDEDFSEQAEELAEPLTVGTGDRFMLN
jgi:hypothetical protein